MIDPEQNGRSDASNFRSTQDEAFPPLPPPHSPGQGGQDDRDHSGNEEDEEGNVSKLAEVPAAKRKGVKRPQPKLDSNRLISERGLPALRTMFDDVHFRGKGHEAADLRLLMQKMENWAHRLFPKLQFEDFIDKVEKLGTKKEVQTCLKRIRLDMPLTHEDFGNEGEEAEAKLETLEDPDPFSGARFTNEAQRPVHSTPAPAAPSLTEEQQRRMELNRQRALERRLARHNQQQEADSTDSQAVGTPADEPPSVSSEDVLNRSDDRGNGDEEATEHLEVEPHGSGTQPPSQAPPTESEASAESSQQEDETRQRPDSNECEDRD